MQKPSVMIGLATNGDMKMETAASLIMATNLVRTIGHSMTLAMRSGPYTHWNREHLANDALEEGTDYLMFVDTDVMFPPDGIARLLGHAKPVAGGMYNLKQDEPVTTIKLWADDGVSFKPVKDEPIPNEPFKVAAVPTGFMLIATEVLSAIPTPRFPCVFAETGEDVAFCLAAQAAGFDVWCDPTIDIKHVGTKHY